MPNSNIPDNYFDELNKKVLNKIADLGDDLKTNAPLLSKIEKNNFYKVPDNYFIGHERLTLNKLKSPNRTRNLYRFSVAAVLLILLSASLWTFNIQKDIETSDAIAELNYINYLLEEDHIIESDVIISLALESDINSDLDFDELSDSELESYLNNIIDDIPLEELTIFEI